MKGFSLILGLIFVISQGNGERTKDKMYEAIPGSSCYRRLNATHQIGCSSKRGGSTGVLHFCDQQEDLNFILRNGTASPYIPVLSAKLFTLDNINRLKKSKVVSGLVVYPKNDSSPFTHDHKCPNQLFNFKGSCDKESNSWNPLGSGLLFADIPFPVFYVEDWESVQKMKDCFQKFNNFSYETQADRSLCSLELNSFMYAATSTPTCQRRSNIITNLNPMKVCDPLGDSNVWASLFPLVKGPANNSTAIEASKYIVIAARIDTTSFFEKTVGANSPVTGVVALLAVAKTLKTMLPTNTIITDSNVLFIIFNGESYDYIGSQRMLYDMNKGNFPIDNVAKNPILPLIKPENISMFVELSQLGNSQNSLNVHYLKTSTQITQFYNKLTKNKKSFELQSFNDSIPPASLHTFLNNNQDFPGIILSDHAHIYSNPYYNSIYDDVQNIQYKYYNVSSIENATQIPKDSIQQYISDVSEMIARSVFEELTGSSYQGDYSSSYVVSLVDELIHCYLEDPNCRVRQAVQKMEFGPIPNSLYVGVYGNSNFATSFTYKALNWLIGDVVNTTKENCTSSSDYVYKYFNMSESLFNLNNTICYKFTSNTTAALSPAFIIDDYDWTSGKYSTWSESTWEDLYMRMYLKPSLAHENLTITIGALSILFSFIIVWFIKSKSDILFVNPLPTEAPANC